MLLWTQPEGWQIEDRHISGWEVKVDYYYAETVMRSFDLSEVDQGLLLGRTEISVRAVSNNEIHNNIRFTDSEFSEPIIIHRDIWVPLGTPENLQICGDYLKWNDVANANTYQIFYRDGNNEYVPVVYPIGLTVESRFNIVNFNQFIPFDAQIRVRATAHAVNMGGYSIFYTASPQSSAVQFVNPFMPAPRLNLIGGNLIWDFRFEPPIPATQYRFFIDDGYEITTKIITAVGMSVPLGEVINTSAAVWIRVQALSPGSYNGVELQDSSLSNIILAT